MTSDTSTAATFSSKAHEHASLRKIALNKLSSTALKSAVSFWFLVTVIGQLIFVVYIAVLYGSSAMLGKFTGWNKVMLHGYVAGDTAGNMALGTHLLLAAVILLAGALQLIPLVRARIPSFHRWNGRIYLCGAVIASLTGLYMVWVRGTVGDVVQHIGTSVNAVLILMFAGMAVRLALAHDFPAHRRWALRLFLSVGGVWFFRVGLMFWIAVNRGPAGFDPKTFQGPFLSFLAFAQYLLPLAILQLYLHCRERDNAVANLSMAATLLGLGIATAVGVAMATVGMWLPNI